jgi:PmbA protein
MTLPTHALHASALDPELLAAVASTTPGASDWRIEILHEEEAQLYVIGDRVEARRAVANERARLAVFNDHAPKDPDAGSVARGVTGLTLLAADVADPAHLAARLREAVTVAGLTDNPPFPLPTMPADGYPSVVTVDPVLAGDLAAPLDETMARLEAAVAEQDGVRLSSAELYATRASRSLRNSRGLTAAGRGTGVMLDFVLIASESGREAEMHGEFERRRLADLNVEALIKLHASYARHSLRATAPTTHRGPVVISGAAVAELFNQRLEFGGGPFRLHASAEAAYQHISQFEPGAFISREEPRGDRLTVFSDPLRPFGTQTYAFDAEGLPARRLTIIENGVFAHRWADTRYAAYLGIEATGAFANITIVPGTTPLRALRDVSAGPIYEVSAFSFFNPDPISGDFVVEIKLGYRHDERGTQPIKGGSLSGNLFTAFADARFSIETYTDGAYLGPAAIRFGDLSISGS